MAAKNKGKNRKTKVLVAKCRSAGIASYRLALLQAQQQRRAEKRAQEGKQ